MTSDASYKTLLIFPPVWTPVTPYLAFPILVAYLRNRGLSTKQYDASLDFFTRYLLDPDTLLEIWGQINKRRKSNDYSNAPDETKELLRDLEANENQWLERISRVKITLDLLRHEHHFFHPVTCIRAQSDLYHLLNLASLAYYPLSFTFNTFHAPDIHDFSTLLLFLDDPERNPFLTFYFNMVARKLEHEHPSLVGISVSTSHQLIGALSLARFVKKRMPSVHVTFGGRHIPRLQEALKTNPAFFSRFCDSLVLDNGERPLHALIDCLRDGRDPNVVPNLVHFSKDRYRFNGFEAHEPIDRLVPPDFSDLALENYLAPNPIIPMRLSEGCYWGKCTFCSRYDNKKFRSVPPEKAAEQIAHLHRQLGASCFTINDDCLTPPYLEAFSRAVIDRGLSLTFSLWCKPVGQFTKERLELMSRAGVRLVRWGVETGNPRILRLMNKGTNLGDTLRIMKDSAEAGIWNHATVILGFPTETEEEAWQTARFLEEHREVIHSSIFFRFVLLEHSYIMQHPEEFHISTISDKESFFSSEHPYRCSKGMDEGRLSQVLRQIQRYRVSRIYRHPLWFHLRIREYLLLYAARYTLADLASWRVDPGNLSVFQGPPSENAQSWSHSESGHPQKEDPGP